LARNYESNGPDVKIRGTAAHIAEKYMSLARDALASGDMITAESYLQHAEHYNRIIMAAQSQFGPQGAHHGDGPNGGGGFRSRFSPDGPDSLDEGADLGAAEGGGETGGGDGRGSRDARHGGGRDRGRQGGNGSDAARDTNGAEPSEAQPTDETAPDQVS
jgi:hypothetical protein